LSLSCVVARAGEPAHRSPNPRCFGAYLRTLSTLFLLLGDGDGDGVDETDNDTVGDDPVSDNQSASTGDFASNFIASGIYESMVIEIDYVTGHAPVPAALSEMTARLQLLRDKPGGTTVNIDDEMPAQGAPAWTIGDTRDLEEEYRDQYREAGVAVLHMLYLDGNSARDQGNSRILGYAYQGSSIVMFQETIDDLSGRLLAGDIEPVVLLHEVGHQLGLVNLGTPTTTATMTTTRASCSGRSRPPLSLTCCSVAHRTSTTPASTTSPLRVGFHASYCAARRSPIWAAASIIRAPGRKPVASMTTTSAPKRTQRPWVSAPLMATVSDWICVGR
jgi:hypothetical protein